MERNKSFKIRRLCVTAVMIALATVLSLIKVYPLPLGGSVTLLSMFPIVLLALMYGTSWGLIGAFMYSVVQLILGITVDGLIGMCPTAFVLIGSIFFDYIIAFTVLGLAGLLREKGIVGCCLGVALALALRFVSHFVSGLIFFGIFTSANTWIHSLIYNGSYMLPEMIITVIATAIFLSSKAVRKLITDNN